MREVSVSPTTHPEVTCWAPQRVYFLPMERFPTVRDAKEYLIGGTRMCKTSRRAGRPFAVAEVLVFERKRA